MGYSTAFYGEIEIIPPLDPMDIAAINEFSESRHEAVEGLPNYWCDWIATDDGEFIQWNGGEKFYNAAEWMKVVLDKFVNRAVHTANGEINAFGEDRDDIWKLVVQDNQVSVQQATVSFEEPKEI